MSKRKSVLTALPLLVLLWFPAHALAQSSSTGAIAGAARDTTGAVVPGVTVQISTSSAWSGSYAAAAGGFHSPQNGPCRMRRIPFCCRPRSGTAPLPDYIRMIRGQAEKMSN